MGLLDSIAGQVVGALSNADSSKHAGLIEAIGSLLNNQQTGGLQGLIRVFEQKGLGGVVASWVGTGHNLPISAQQLESVIGSAQVQAFAQKIGLSPQEVSSHLSELLPQVVDKLTPSGTLPEEGALESATGRLKGFLK